MISYNGVALDNVTYNGVTLTELFFNSQHVWPDDGSIQINFHFCPFTSNTQTDMSTISVAETPIFSVTNIPDAAEISYCIGIGNKSESVSEAHIQNWDICGHYVQCLYYDDGSKFQTGCAATGKTGSDSTCWGCSVSYSSKTKTGEYSGGTVCSDAVTLSSSTGRYGTCYSTSGCRSSLTSSVMVSCSRDPDDGRWSCVCRFCYTDCYYAGCSNGSTGFVGCPTNIAVCAKVTFNGKNYVICQTLENTAVDKTVTIVEHWVKYMEPDIASSITNTSSAEGNTTCAHVEAGYLKVPKSAYCDYTFTVFWEGSPACSCAHLYDESADQMYCRGCFVVCPDECGIARLCWDVPNATYPLYWCTVGRQRDYMVKVCINARKAGCSRTWNLGNYVYLTGFQNPDTCWDGGTADYRTVTCSQIVKNILDLPDNLYCHNTYEGPNRFCDCVVME